MTLNVTPLSDVLGVEITGVDLSRPLDDAAFAEVSDHCHRDQVVVFRDQSLDPEQQIAFSRRFGGLDIHIAEEYLLDGYPEILLVSNKQVDGRHIGLAQAGKDWHSDLSYQEKPSMASILHAIELPASGGDTEWVDMYAAYETLPDETKRRIAGLRAMHSYDRRLNPRITLPRQSRDDPNAAYQRSPPGVAHPVVRTHPKTGRKALFVSPRYTVAMEGMDDSGGQTLLDELLAHAISPRFTYRHQWRPGDLVFWDNRCTLHLACGGVEPPEVRHMHRTSISGDVPF